MRIATDLSEEDRRYYVPFIESHLENIEKWRGKTFYKKRK